MAKALVLAELMLLLLFPLHPFMPAIPHVWSAEGLRRNAFMLFAEWINLLSFNREYKQTEKGCGFESRTGQIIFKI